MLRLLTVPLLRSLTVPRDARSGSVPGDGHLLDQYRAGARAATQIDVVTDVDPAYPTPTLTKCGAARKKCVGKKAAGLMGCSSKLSKDGIGDPTCAPTIMDKFWGLGTYGQPAINFVIRSERAGTASFVREIEQAVWSVNGDMPVFLVRTMDELYADSLARTSFTLVMLGIAGLIALGLGVIGIYGVIAYVVSQRAREIGIRLALGAQARSVKRMFVRQGLAVAAVGVAVGLVAAVALSRVLTSFLFEVRPLDLPTYVAVLGVLLVAVTLAAYLPARRAARLDPMETLRAE